MIGITTQTFMNQLIRNEISTEEIIRWASKQGFSWVEVRDRDVGFGKPYLEEISGLAKSLGVKLHYAWDGGNLLKPDDEGLFSKGIENACVFGKGTLSRITIATSNIADIPSKKGYTEEEFNEICSKIQKYHSIAREKG